MLTVKLVYKLSDMSDDMKWVTNTHMTPFTLTFNAYLTISMVLEDPFLLFHFFYPSTTRPPIFLPVHIRFYPSLGRVDGSLHKAMCLCHFKAIRIV